MSDRNQARKLVQELWNNEIDRRQFVARAAAVGLSSSTISAALHGSQAVAQDATPASPVTGTPAGATPAAATRSMTRQEYLQQLQDQFELGEPESEGGQVIYALTSDINTTNPHLAGDIYSLLIADLVFDYLTEASAIDGQMVPRLADYWEVAEDGVTYTFHMNPEATWHDGEPVTAEDVVFSFDATLGEGSLSRRQSVVRDVLESYRAIDEHTVELVSPTPIATFLENTTWLVAILPKHIWGDVPLADWGSDPGSTGQDPARVVGSGAFTFTEWVADDHITVTRNQNWRAPEPTAVIDEFTIRVIPEQSTALQALTTGEIDIISIPGGQAVNFESDPALTLHTYPSSGYSMYSANMDPERSPLFTDVRVRQALMYALDRELMAEQIYAGYSEPAIGTQTPLSAAYAPDQINTVYNFDPDRARQLLDEAGWIEGDDGIRVKDGVRFSFEALYSEGSAAYDQQMPYMQQVWQDVGIEMIPTRVPFGAMGDQTRPGNFDMAFYGFFWGYDGSQGDMFRCDAVPPDGFNSMRYCNPEYDELDRQAARELDPERRIDLLIEATNIVNDEVAAGVLFFNQEIMGAQNRVHNFIPNGYALFWSLPYMWLESTS